MDKNMISILSYRTLFLILADLSESDELPEGFEYEIKKEILGDQISKMEDVFRLSQSSGIN